MSSFIEDISNGLERTKVSFINEIDCECFLPKNFEYSSCCVISIGAYLEDFESSPRPCSCSAQCCADSCQCLLCYGSFYSNFLLNFEALDMSNRPIIECSCLCTCSDECSNRLVQRGISYKLQVFKTKRKGFGVRTLQRIPESAFVCEYAGEVIGKEEASKRYQAQKASGQSNYLFVLRENVDGKNASYTIVDPTDTGNVGRFVNHSCSPNLVVVPVRVDCMVPRLCLFATRDILPLDELCYNYGVFTSTDIEPEECLQCFCEGVDCTGFIPYIPDILNM